METRTGSVAGTAGSAGRSKSMVLTAMIFAVAMTFIDQTIVSIAAPKIQEDLGLSSSGMQWAINAYLLSLAALFAFGGRLADTVGHRRMVVLGVIIFAGSSALCGLTPRGGLAETWIVAFRAVQGLGGAIMFPAALAIVVQTFELHTRGWALAGHLLDQCARRAHRPGADRHLQAGHRASPMDYRGLALLGVFVVVEHRTASPLMNVRIFGNRAFLVENVILLIVMMAFIPVFFFVSGGQWCSAARWQRRGSRSGRARRPTCIPDPRSSTSSSPGPAWASCSGRPTPTR